jgi:hypothetical protein
MLIGIAIGIDVLKVDPDFDDSPTLRRRAVKFLP